MIVPQTEKPVAVTAGTAADSQRNALDVPVEPEVASRPVSVAEPDSQTGMIPQPATTPAPAALTARTESAAVPDAPARRESPARSAVKMRDGLEEGKSYANPLRVPVVGEVRLAGIFSSKSKAMAIINGKVATEGETVGPLVVEKIERGRVQLRYIDVRFWPSY